MLNFIAGAFILAGLFFFFVGVVGLLRFPDPLSRMHASTKTDTLGVGLMTVGFILLKGATFESITLLFLVAFMWLTNPTASHYLAKTLVANREKVNDGNDS
jgi:monovalent cation/proton antiporter, MnhG/PhaG subunit